MNLRLRLSLLFRMGVAAGILCSISLVLAFFLAIFGGVLGFAFVAWSRDALAALGSLPRVSAVAPVPPVLVAAVSALVVVVVVKGWPQVRAHTGLEYLLPPDTPGAAAVVAGLLGCLYLVVVEGSAAAATALTTTGGLLVMFALGAVATIWMTISDVRKRIRRLQDRMSEDSSLLEHTEPEVAATVRRLAQQADVPEPTVRIVGTERPESVTVGSGENAVVLVSTGLVDRLSDPELEAVLAHEVAHLANGDSRVMSAALGPVLAADEWLEEDPDELGDYVWNWAFGALKRYGQFGVAFLSRGRETAADVAAAELAGSPAALASALERLTEARNRPGTDLREWEESVAAMDILPPAKPDVSTGPFRTHPPTEERIKNLRNRTISAEREEGRGNS